jgi:hypothetical protein
MTNLMKVLAITVAVLFNTMDAANAWYSSDANSSSIGSISVILADDAQNACWTNLRETREYAEEKLEIEGYNVLPEGGEYDFIINVMGVRNNRGMCFGFVTVDIRTFNYRNRVGGAHQIGFQIGAILDPDNLNTLVIEVISNMFAEM